jgi:hypothetical protein
MELNPSFCSDCNIDFVQRDLEDFQQGDNEDFNRGNDSDNGEASDDYCDDDYDEYYDEEEGFVTGSKVQKGSKMPGPSKMP